MEVSFANVVLLQIFAKIIFLRPYNARNLVLLSPGCCDEGAALLFPVFIPPQLFFFWQKAKIGFRSTESNGSFFLPFSRGDVSTLLTVRTYP